MTVDSTETVTLAPLNSSPAHRLGEWGATAICGNDITSSCLYVAALATILISASAAMHYAQNFVPGLPVDWATVALLGLFAVRISELGGVRLII